MNVGSVVQFNAATTIGGGRQKAGRMTNFPIPGAAVGFNLPKEGENNETSVLQVWAGRLFWLGL